MSLSYTDCIWILSIGLTFGKKNAPILEKLRDKELQELNTVVALTNLAPAFEHARLKGDIRPSSGLVELQRYFLKFRIKTTI